jgi:gliding motility-associated-like protein
MKRLSVAFWGILACSLPMLQAQQDCSALALDAGNDLTYCQGGDSVLLTPAFNGIPLEVTWAPQSGLGSPASLNTAAAPAETTTYALRVRAVSADNLVFNGDFSQGNIGFTSNYQLGTGGNFGLLSLAGRYAIATNAANTHSNFAPCTDHTTGNGNMMVVNGAGTPINVWCQTITVEPNTDYAFSAWVTSVISQTPAQLQFSINGVSLGEVFTASPTTCLWQQFYAFWNSGTSTNAQICIRNLNTVNAGNDFAIDDISFSIVCEYEDMVTVNVEEAPPGPQVDCSSTSSSVLLEWAPVAGASGYTINVLNGPAGMMLTDTSFLLTGLDPGQEVEIEVIALIPGNECGDGVTRLVCSAAPCPVVNVSLDGPATVCQGEGADFTLTIDTDSPGPFTLSIDTGLGVIDLPNLQPGANVFSPALVFSTTLTAVALADASASNCSFSGFPPPFTVEVNPPADAGQGGESSFCVGDEALLSLADLVQGGQDGGQWADVSASPVGSAFDAVGASLSSSGLLPGLYRFEYTVPGLPGCSSSSTVVEIVAHALPEADAGGTFVLDCSADEIRLGGPGTSQGTGLSYAWQAVEGAALTGTNTPNAAAQSAGVYAFAVTDVATGCTGRDTALVEERITAPVPEVSTISLACAGQAQGLIRVESVDGGPGPYLYSINGGPFGPEPEFDGLAAGRYEIAVQDANQCQGSIEVLLEQPRELMIDLLARQGGTPPSIRLGDSLLLEVVANLLPGEIASVDWDPVPPGCENCLEAYVAPLRRQIYTVTVTDVNGCEAVASLAVNVDPSVRLFVPNAFSPNEDGRNDRFFPYAGAEVKMVQQLYIADRWGNLVFSQDNFPPNDPTQGWDGIFRGKPAASGIYVYALKLELVNGEVYKHAGELNLIR